jgi:hypothetical protein
MAGREDRKTELIAALASARSRMIESSGGVRKGLDTPQRIRHSVSKHLAWWVGGAVLLGVVVARWPRRPRKVVIEHGKKEVDTASVAKGGMALAAVKLAFDITRPLLMKIVMQKVRPMIEDWLIRRQGTRGRE